MMLKQCSSYKNFNFIFMNMLEKRGLEQFCQSFLLEDDSNYVLDRTKKPNQQRVMCTQSYP